MTLAFSSTTLLVNGCCSTALYLLVSPSKPLSPIPVFISKLISLSSNSNNDILTCLYEHFVWGTIHVTISSSALVIVNPHRYISSNANPVLQKYTTDYQSTANNNPPSFLLVNVSSPILPHALYIQPKTNYSSSGAFPFFLALCLNIKLPVCQNWCSHLPTLVKLNCGTHELFSLPFSCPHWAKLWHTWALSPPLFFTLVEPNHDTHGLPPPLPSYSLQAKLWHAWVLPSHFPGPINSNHGTYRLPFLPPPILIELNHGMHGLPPPPPSYPCQTKP